MELKNLQYLDSIYRLRSFTKAAEEHYISQPSISNAIQKLENELGVILIRRNEKPLAFTEDGERFMCHVSNILEAVDDAIQDMKSRSCLLEQTLHLAWASTLGDCLLPRIYTQFHESYPQCQVLLWEQTLHNILTLLTADQIDLAYALIPENYDPNTLEVIPLQFCEMRVLLSKDHPLASHKQLSLTMLRNEKILTFPSGSLIRTKLEEKFKELHIVPNLYPVNQVAVMENLVSENYGITLLAVDEINSITNNKNIVLLPLKEPITFLKGFILKRGCRRTVPMKQMISFVENVLHNYRIQNNSRQSEDATAKSGDR